MKDGEMIIDDFLQELREFDEELNERTDNKETNQST